MSKRKQILYDIPRARDKSAAFLAKRPALRRLDGESGTSLVEFAFIFILLVSLLMGIMGFGHMLYTYHFVNHAAKEAARWAIVNGNNCTADASCTAPVTCNNGSCTTCTSSCQAAAAADIQSYAIGLTPPGLDYTQVDAAASFPGSAVANSPTVCATTSNSDGCTVKVTVAYAYNFMFPLLPVVTTTTAPCTHAGLCLSSTSELVIVH